MPFTCNIYRSSDIWKWMNLKNQYQALAEPVTLWRIVYFGPEADEVESLRRAVVGPDDSVILSLVVSVAKGSWMFDRPEFIEGPVPSLVSRRSIIRDTVAIPALISLLTSEPRSDIALFRENSFSFHPLVLFVIDSLYLFCHYRRNSQLNTCFDSNAPSIYLNFLSCLLKTKFSIYILLYVKASPHGLDEFPYLSREYLQEATISRGKWKFTFHKDEYVIRIVEAY